MIYEKYMEQALELARESYKEGDVPVGCVIVNGKGEVIGMGRNRREIHCCAISHAEIEAVSKACASVGDWRLSDCTMYVTLEPCPMCAGAVINSRISVLVYGAKEPVSGSCGSVINLFEENYGHKPKIYGGILADESVGLLRKFFAKLR